MYLSAMVGVEGEREGEMRDGSEGGQRALEKMFYSVPYMTMSDRRAAAALGGKVACCVPVDTIRATMSRARGCPMSPTRFILFWTRKLVSSRFLAVHLPTRVFSAVP